VKADLMSLNRHLWSMGIVGNPMSELTLTPRRSWLNSHKMTMNLGSELVKNSGAEMWRTMDSPLVVLFLAAGNGPRFDGFSANSFRANIPPFNCRGAID
jgi:hypothetical protein